MDDLRRMVVFYHVVKFQSFSGAANALGIAKSAVSRHINLLESSLGARLLHRTTRKLRLTEVGESYYQSCARIVAEAENAKQHVTLLQEEPKGLLRIAAPTSLGNRFIAPLIQQFSEKYPELNIELLLDDQEVDMIAASIDLSIRIGWLEDSNFIAQKLRDWPRYLCASDVYLKKYGTPNNIKHLAQHEWIIFTLLPTPYQWVFTKGKRKEKINIKGRVKTNNADAVRTLLLAGAGIAALSEFIVGEDIKSGKLKHILPDFDCGSAGMYAVYQNRQYQPAKVRLFVEFIRHKLSLIQ